MSGLRDLVLARLRPADVCAAFDIELDGKDSAKERRTKSCPTCGEFDTDWVSINMITGRWNHFSAACDGDVFDLVAGYARLNVRGDFPKVLAAAAAIAGIVVDGGVYSASDIDRATAERKAEDARRRAKADAEDRAKRIEAARTWERADLRSSRGEQYLANRRLDVADLIARGRVRFDPDGNPTVAIYGHDTGEVVGIARRIIGRTGNGKVIVTGITDGTMIGRVAELDRQGPDVAVVVEGVTDGLAAVSVWPGCVVLAAHSAGRFASVAAHAARALHAIDGWLLLAPDDGEEGEDAGVAAVLAAQAAGMQLDRDLHLVDIDPHEDLNAALVAGWRWSWPSVT